MPRFTPCLEKHTGEVPRHRRNTERWLEGNALRALTATSQRYGLGEILAESKRSLGQKPGMAREVT